MVALFGVEVGPRDVGPTDPSAPHNDHGDTSDDNPAWTSEQSLAAARCLALLPSPVPTVGELEV